MTNRLESLPSGQDFETKISDNNTSSDLKNHLENIKKVLKDNPSKEEIDSAKKFLDSLSSLKNAFEKSKNQSGDEIKQKLDKLSGELGIYTETQILIESLRTKGEGVETNNEKVEFEGLFKETKNKMIIEIKNGLSEAVDKNKIFSKFDSQKREKIKVGLTARLVNSGLADSLMGGFTGKINGYDKLVSGKNPLNMEVLNKVFSDEKKEIKENDKDGLESQIESQIKIIENFISKNEKDIRLNDFLSNTKNIENLTNESTLDNIEFASPKDEKEAFELLRNKIQGFDSKLMAVEKTKDHIFNEVSNMPDFITNAIVSFISWLCNLDFIGNIIKKFLGLKGNGENEIENELKGEFDARKSIKVLQSFGIQYGPNGEKTESTNNPAIEVLKGKDLSSLDVKKLKPFLVKMKEKGIDIASEGFWYNLLNRNRVDIISKIEGQKDVTKSIIIPPKLTINEKDFEKEGIIGEGFYEKLNNIYGEIEIQQPSDTADKGEKTTAASQSKTPISASEVNITLAKYNNLLYSPAITNEIASKLKDIDLRDMIRKNEGELKQILKDKKIEDVALLAILLQYSELITSLALNGNKLDEFEQACLLDKKDISAKGKVTMMDVIYNRYNLVKYQTGITPEYKDSTTQITATNKKETTTQPEGDKGDKETEVATNDSLPSKLYFNPLNQVAVIDGKQYKISLKDGETEIKIEDINYKKSDAKMIVKGSKLAGFFKGEKVYSGKDLTELYTKVKPLNNGQSIVINNTKKDVEKVEKDNDYSLTITALT